MDIVNSVAKLWERWVKGGGGQWGGKNQQQKPKADICNIFNNTSKYKLKNKTKKSFTNF